MSQTNTFDSKRKFQKRFQKGGKPKREFKPEFEGHNPNHVYEEPKRHLPKKFQNRNNLKSEEEAAEVKTTLKVQEEVKQNDTIKSKPKPKQSSTTEKSLLQLDPKFVDSFKMSVEESCRCRVDLNINLPNSFVWAYSKFASEKQAYYGHTFNPSQTLRSIVTIACVAQLLNATGGDKRRSLTHLSKFTEIDVHLPTLLGSLIKTLGDFDGEYGKIEVNHVIHYCLSIMCKAYKQEPNGFQIKVFDKVDFNTVHVLPWASEGFDYFREIAVDHLKTIERSLSGIVVSLPLPIPEDTKDAYLTKLEGWKDRMNDIRPALDLYFIERSKYKAIMELGGKEYSMVDASAMLEILQWVNSIIEKYKAKVQPFLIQLGDCQKFTPSSAGNGAQFVRRQNTEVQSSFVVLEDDATIGAIFNYNVDTKIVGNFEGLQIPNLEAIKVNSVVRGLKRKINT